MSRGHASGLDLLACRRPGAETPPLPRIESHHMAADIPPSTEVDDFSLPDIKPHSPVAALAATKWSGRCERFPVSDVAPVVGMSEGFIRRVVGHKGALTVDEVVLLLE